MLSVADGALSGISEILQRQKSLATQATSGSLTDTARGFLNQEFQNLKSEIDRIAQNTNFNGITLIDGSLYAPSAVVSSVRTNATAVSAVITLNTAMTDAKAIIINGQKQNGVAQSAYIYTMDTANMGNVQANSATELNIDDTLNATTTTQATAVFNTINNILAYQGTKTTVITAKNIFSQYNFSNPSAGVLNMSLKAAGAFTSATTQSTFYSIASTMGAGNDLTVGSFNAGNLAAGTAINLGKEGTASVSGDLNAGDFATANTAYQGSATTIAQGAVGDTILRSLTVTNQTTTGVDTSLISNNPAFVGNIIASGGGFKANWTNNNLINLQITVGNYTYEAQEVNTNYAANTIVTLPSVQPGGGALKMQFAANAGVTNVTDQASTGTYITRLNDAVSGVNFYQNRIVSNYVAAGSVYAPASTISVGDLSGSTLNLINSNHAIKFADVNIQAPVLGSYTPIVQFITEQGEVYDGGTGFDGTGATGVAYLNTASTAAGTTAGMKAATTYGFVSKTNPNNVLVLNYTGGSGAVNLDLSTPLNAQGAQAAFKAALGINTGASHINFQVGTLSTDSIGVQIQSATTKSLYIDNNGNYQSVGVDNLNNALASNPILDNAIKAVTAVRSNVGALQSRFNYAAANLSTAIQNQDAARGTFLDTDIAQESTSFAGSQVRVQASISVLAQANQLMQSLLILIG